MAAAALVLPLVAALPEVSRADTQADLQSAQAKFNELNHQIEILDEQYNAAQIQLSQVESQLADVREQKSQADADQAAADARLTQRAHTAYMDSGSQLDVLLGAGDFSDFSDRLEFLNQLESQDASLALTAQNASQRAEWAAQELAKIEGQKAALVKSLAAKKAAGQHAIEQQRQLVSQLHQKLAAEQAAQAAALKKAQQQAAAAAATTGRHRRTPVRARWRRNVEPATGQRKRGVGGSGRRLHGHRNPVRMGRGIAERIRLLRAHDVVVVTRRRLPASQLCCAVRRNAEGRPIPAPTR